MPENVPKPEEFVHRQTENLERLADAIKRGHRVPEQVRTAIEHQEITVEMKATRCGRCGTIVAPLYPQTVLCGHCVRELIHRDQQDNPHCLWWRALLTKLNDKQKGG